jgi:hypothetical protein
LTRRCAYAIVGAAAVVPRLVVLLHERGSILGSFTEKSDAFAQTFVSTGTFGLVPGHPSAYTQPLYGFFLSAIYWTVGRHWLAVGLAQIALAVCAALLVYELGRRWLSPRAGLVAAVVATLNPYLVWHDIHVNREILDTPLAAALTLLTLLAWERRSIALAALDGIALGLAVLGNTRLALLPLVCAAFVVPGWSRRGLAAAAALLAATALVVVPWVVRNGVAVGCYTLTTDSRALWKANNENTYATLAAGGRWIDDVPPLPGAPPSPEQAAEANLVNGTPYTVDECAQMAFFQHRVFRFWRDHPGEKARLSAQAAGMLWQPAAVETAGGPGSGTAVGAIKRWIEPLYLVPLYVLALVGTVVVPRRLAALALALLAYQTLAAVVFAGATRYRAPWDFLIVVLATGGARFLLARASSARSPRRAVA